MNLIKHILIFLIMSFILLTIMLVSYTNINIEDINDIASEYSFIEISQEIILFIIICIYFYMAKQIYILKHICILIGSFFMCMLIRELDFLFDILHHGSWFYFAIITAIIGTTLAFRDKNKLLNGFEYYKNLPYFGMMISGLLTILVFSRLFGTTMFWNLLLPNNYANIVKNIVQEGSEFFGYILCLFSSIYFMIKTRKK
ncbi:MAG: hypothetical protein SPI03_04965 [Campylobacter sputorum]|uniref:hypothetical protein n=1 Tax=Campylobacter sputorum TaxID=206 RepID=UPI000B7860D4|nr:hypothetical protein [Campylobacter sputorum]ASM38684.1 putative membrane protein [Campylobacter sputorum bv. paraureolyticus LMG 11764]MDY6120665.1 hypothetical protein [Campylobacter sputorum]